MERKELNERSPLRRLEKNLHGGSGPGRLGVVVARHGLGKTAFLVGLALDHLLRGRKVLHVSLSQPVDKVLAYYDEIYADLAHARDLADVWKVRLDCERNRRIHRYTDGQLRADRLQDTLGFLRAEADFVPHCLLIDDYPFATATAADLDGLRSVARPLEGEIWLTATTHRDSQVDDRGIPEPVAHLAAAADVILRMAHDGKGVHIAVLKDHDQPRPPDLRLALDPTTLLLVRE